MTQTNKNNFKRTIRICYPAGTATLVIRTDLDWGRDTNPVAVSSDGNTATFEIEAQQRFVHFKPCLIKNGSLHWTVGPDNLLIMAGKDARPVYPYFFSDSRGRFSPIVQIESAILGRHHRLRIYLPPGYDENTTARYPLAYMQDGHNLFFPQEAFRHEHWEIDETSQVLRAMRAIEDVKRCRLRLQEKGGQQHQVPVHHKAEEYLDAYIAAAGIEKGSPLWRCMTKERGLGEARLDRVSVYKMIQRRIRQAELNARANCHTFRATGITAYLLNGGTIEKAQAIAAHESPRTTKLYDRTTDEITLDEVERIAI